MRLWMDQADLAEALIEAAERLGARVRVEPFETPAASGGGLCRLRDEVLIVLDAGAPLRMRIEVLARALAALDNERIYIVPEAREVVEQATNAGGAFWTR